MQQNRFDFFLCVVFKKHVYATKRFFLNRLDCKKMCPFEFEKEPKTKQTTKKNKTKQKQNKKQKQKQKQKPKQKQNKTKNIKKQKRKKKTLFGTFCHSSIHIINFPA